VRVTIIFVLERGKIHQTTGIGGCGRKGVCNTCRIIARDETRLGRIVPREFRGNALPCSFYSRSIARNENRGTPACRAWKRREEAEWGKGELIEILIAGICRPRAQHPYVNRKRRFAFRLMTRE